MVYDNDLISIFGVTNTLKGEVVVLVEGLIKIGIDPIMIIGENWKTSQAIAKEVDITYVRARVRPTRKADTILSLQKCEKIVGEREINTILIQHGDVFKVKTLILYPKMPANEYVVQNQIEEDENRPPVDEEKKFEKEQRLENMISDEDATYDSEENHNETYAILYYLLNPRVVKRMVQPSQAVPTVF
ncbi:G-type lectin S-receptor-like serine/threonine-protein kinase B120 [Olea europaea subsp. europaea]|uniref:G-type lectin S-receptor-like serine/threonine-protein kinase B120 n=1 Tax=Olea europaea subsp. europaea TaxID=158383 RepID=A0A8S0STF4_OLEEU|nr:G-type lectin S-receptor-like serine/threonine-protein kinase B120 [Olea europaea subsp. europaea]